MNLQQALEKFGNREVNEDELEKLLNPQGRVKPKYGEKYYYINGLGCVCNCVWVNDETDEYRFKVRNVFLSQGEAERALEIRNAFLDASFEPDWSINDQDKWYIYADISCNECLIDYSYHINNASYYFKTKEIAQSLIDKFDEEDIKKYIFHVYE